MSKSKLLVAFSIILFLLMPSVSLGHALYTVPLPSSTIYADDFENYPIGQLKPMYNGVLGNSSWSWADNAVGGIRAISQSNYFSCCKSLLMTSSTVQSGKFDIHREIAIPNSTTIVSGSAWFAFDNKTRNRNDQLTFSIETWDYAHKYECNIFVIPASPAVQVGSDDGVITWSLRLAAFDDSRFNFTSAGTFGSGQWHHLSMTCNLLTKTYVNVQVDNWNLNNVSGKRFESINDVEMLLASKPFTIPLRFEHAEVNANPTFTNPTDIWHTWMDDLIITDVSAGQPSIIQFGLVGYSAWIPLIMAMAGANTTLSTWSLVIRLLRKNDGSAVRGLLVAHTKMIVGMNIAVVAFLIVLVIGSIYLPGTCPAGSVCKG